VSIYFLSSLFLSFFLSFFLTFIGMIQLHLGALFWLAILSFGIYKIPGNLDGIVEDLVIILLEIDPLHTVHTSFYTPTLGNGKFDAGNNYS
jgi:hypothetical protein